MLEYATFEHFARDLMMLNCNNYFGIDENELRVPVSLMDDSIFVKDYFADGHCEIFKPLFLKNEYVDLRTDEHFLRYTIPRCLNLVDKERCFYSLMLIAAFLDEFLYRLNETRKCNRFYFTAYKCLLAVFKRSLEDSFHSLGGFNGLKRYLNGIMKGVYKEEYKLIVDHLNQGKDHLRDRVVKLIENCDNFSEESFHLNVYELSLIRDDDVKNIIEILESEEIDEDPLDLKWPPPEDEMQEVLESYRTRLANYNPSLRSFDVYTRLFDGCYDSESDSEESDSLTISREPTDFENYMSELYDQAKERYGYKVLHKKMALRKCPCCGIKCYQFSRNLYLKQFDSALIRKIPKWKNSLRKFIENTRYKISRVFNPVIIYKAKEVPTNN